MVMSELFVSQEPLLEDYWRGIILYGRNVASYKFALAKTLLELQPQSGELLKLTDLAVVYVKHITEHLKQVDKQATSSSSKFLDACRRFNQGELSQNQVIEYTLRYGFKNVIDAFHIVGQSETKKRFYIDERRQHDGIRITDEFSQLLEQSQSINLPLEVESRWRLVETAWELNISRNLLTIDFDKETEFLFTLDLSKKRKSVTSSRDALNGYQKGKCFYCFSDIYIQGQQSYPEVDHFLPHRLKQNREFKTVNLDGIWNLVLSCQSCNRGVNGKFDRIPTLSLMERLNTRNEFLISSHHPLRETLIKQTGKTTTQRRYFLNYYYNESKRYLLHTWQPTEQLPEAF